MNFIERIQQKPEGQRKFLMLVSMVALSFLVLAIAWKSFERNLGVRLGGVPAEEEVQTPGLLQSLVEDVKRITRGETPLIQETSGMEQETRDGLVRRIFSIAREIRRVVKYNAGEIAVWAHGAGGWFWEQLR